MSGLVAGLVAGSGAHLVNGLLGEYQESLSEGLIPIVLGVALVTSLIITAVVLLALGLPLRRHRLLLLFGTLSQALVLGSGFYAWYAFPLVVCLISVVAAIRRLGFPEGWLGVLGPIALLLLGALLIPIDYELQSWMWAYPGLGPWAFFLAAWVVPLTLSVGWAKTKISRREARLGRT